MEQEDIIHIGEIIKTDGFILDEKTEVIQSCNKILNLEPKQNLANIFCRTSK